MDTCSTCKHWQESDAWDVKQGGLRKCSRVQPRWVVEDAVPAAIREGKYGYTGDRDPMTAAYEAATEELFAAAKAVVQDGSQYVAELLTRPDFGCVLHEPL